MSAYIVEPETIDRIVDYLIDRYRDGEIGQTHYPAICEAYEGENPSKLGQALLAMNVRAVDQRYDEKNPVPLYHFNPRAASFVQRYKSLRCFLYQCSEGDVPESRLFKELDQASADLAGKIIAGLPEYDQALWA